MLIRINRLILFFSFILFQANLFSDDAIDQQPKEPDLQNIRQLTIPSMGFEKAGEAYFSPDGSTILSSCARRPGTLSDLPDECGRRHSDDGEHGKRSLHVRLLSAR